jgi:Regulator of G protein signaling domain
MSEQSDSGSISSSVAMMNASTSHSPDLATTAIGAAALLDSFGSPPLDVGPQTQPPTVITSESMSANQFSSSYTSNWGSGIDFSAATQGPADGEYGSPGRGTAGHNSGSNNPHLPPPKLISHNNESGQMHSDASGFLTYGHGFGVDTTHALNNHSHSRSISGIGAMSSPGGFGAGNLQPMLQMSGAAAGTGAYDSFSDDESAFRASSHLYGSANSRYGEQSPASLSWALVEESEHPFVDDPRGSRDIRDVPPAYIMIIFAFVFPVVFVVTCTPVVLFVMVLFRPDLADDVQSSHIITMCAIGYFVCFVIVHTLMLRRLKQQPLRARSPALLIFSSIGAALLMVYATIDARTKMSDAECHIVHLFTVVGYALYMLPYFLRAYRLWHCFQLNRETLSNQGQFFESKKYRMTQKYLLKWLCVLTIPFLALGIWSVLTKNEVIPLCHEHSHSYYSNFWIAAHSFEAIGFIFSAVIVKNVWDSYSIRSELIIAAIVTVVFDAALVVFQARNFKRESHLEIMLLVMGRIFVLFIASTLWPVYRTYFRQSSMVFLPNKGAVASFDELLQDPTCFGYFQRFMVSELKADALKFWTELELFREIPEQTERHSEARRIFDYYIKGKRVPISASIRDMLKHRLDQPSATIFDEVQREFYLLLEATCYPRFLQSEHCAELMREMDAQEQVVGRLINSEVI